MRLYYPVFLDLRRRRCVVIGGGLVGERKVQALLACGARVTLVSPTATPALLALARAGRIVHLTRPFTPRDLAGCVLAVAATGRPAVDDEIAGVARRSRVLLNVVDRPSRCDFIVPSVLRRGALQIAVSTGGRSPALAREIRKDLEPLFPPDYGAFVARVGRARARARQAANSPRDRKEAAEQVVRAARAGGAPWGRVRHSGESVGQGCPTSRKGARRPEGTTT